MLTEIHDASLHFSLTSPFHEYTGLYRYLCPSFYACASHTRAAIVIPHLTSSTKTLSVPYITTSKAQCQCLRDTCSSTGYNIPFPTTSKHKQTSLVPRLPNTLTSLYHLALPHPKHTNHVPSSLNHHCLHLRPLYYHPLHRHRLLQSNVCLLPSRDVIHHHQ